MCACPFGVGGSAGPNGALFSSGVRAAGAGSRRSRRDVRPPLRKYWPFAQSNQLPGRQCSAADPIDQSPRRTPLMITANASQQLINPCARVSRSVVICSTSSLSRQMALSCLWPFDSKHDISHASLSCHGAGFFVGAPSAGCAQQHFKRGCQQSQRALHLTLTHRVERCQTLRSATNGPRAARRQQLAQHPLRAAISARTSSPLGGEKRAAPRPAATSQVRRQRRSEPVPNPRRGRCRETAREVRRISDSACADSGSRGQCGASVPNRRRFMPALNCYAGDVNARSRPRHPRMRPMCPRSCGNLE